MGRRTTPNPDASPAIYLFASALRALRAAAGPDAPTPAAIRGVARATVYAALRGSQLPRPHSLRAIVTAWGGDPGEWMVRRAVAETGTLPSGPTALGILFRTRERDRWRRKIARRDYDDARANGKEQRPYTKAVEHEYMADVYGYDIDLEMIAEHRHAMATDLARIQQQAGGPSIREIARRITKATGERIAPNTVKKLLDTPHRTQWPALRGYLMALNPEITEADLDRWRLRQAWLVQPYHTIGIPDINDHTLMV